MLREKKTKEELADLARSPRGTAAPPRRHRRRASAAHRGWLRRRSPRTGRPRTGCRRRSSAPPGMFRRDRSRTGTSSATASRTSTGILQDGYGSSPLPQSTKAGLVGARAAVGDPNSSRRAAIMLSTICQEAAGSRRWAETQQVSTLKRRASRARARRRDRHCGTDPPASSGFFPLLASTIGGMRVTP